MDLLFAYGLRIAPGIALVCLALAVVPRSLAGARVALHVLAFVLVRDAMTPVGLWALEGSGAALSIRFPHKELLLPLAGLCVVLVGFVLLAESGLRARVAWRPRSWPIAVGLGLVSGVLVALPARPHLVQPWLPVLVFSLVGNAYEELLFRGFLQGLLEAHTTPRRAALLSALAFASCHVLLAIVITTVGWPILVFTFWEGLVCAELRRRQGLLPAVLAHGVGIFLVAR